MSRRSSGIDLLRPRVSEKVEQAQIINLLRSIGATVYVFGTRRPKGDRHQGTCQTAGPPDLYAILPIRPLYDKSDCAVWIEVKAEGGRVRPEQRAFQQMCLERSIPHVIGGLTAVITFLTLGGWIRSEQLPHYRQPAMARRSAEQS